MSGFSSSNYDPNAYRGYLRWLARVQLDDRVRGRVDASDIVQETMLEAHRSLKEFQGQTTAEFTSWLRRILARRLAHAFRDHTRQKRDVRREQSLIAILDESSARLESLVDHHVDSPSVGAIDAERMHRLAAALDTLTPDQRDAIVQHYFQGCSVKEVASAMGRGEAGIGGLLHRGMQTLRKHMRED